MFTFCYDDTASCRTTESAVHKLIARTSPQLIPVTKLMEERDVLEKTNIGGKYLFPKNPPSYELSDDRSSVAKVVLLQNPSYPLTSRQRITEGDRSKVIVGALQALSHVKRQIINKRTKY